MGRSLALVLAEITLESSSNNLYLITSLLNKLGHAESFREWDPSPRASLWQRVPRARRPRESFLAESVRDRSPRESVFQGS